ncbi:MAG TPA: AAA family ATPase [Chitinophagaceae bacterium]|nr:AAA family ATPase [Chitinophagaceae bacterium]
MIKTLNIQNFKSLRKAELPLGKITVLTGANNSGKSSFIYSLLALKNTITNPNQSIDACLTLPFINLGGFTQTVFNKDESQNIVLEIVSEEGDIEVAYKLSIGKVTSSLEITSLKPYQFSAKLDVAFPYPANKAEEFEFETDSLQIKFNWNGIIGNILSVSTVGFIDNIADSSQRVIINQTTALLKKIFQLPITEFAKIDFVPLRRGFTQPYFNPVPLSAQISTEEQIASLLGNDRDLVGKVAFYLEKIVDRTFSVYSPPGIATIYLQTMDRKNGFTADLVNEGLGTNQLVTILAKIMQKNNKFVCIDEPEIHLHPTIIDKLVSVLIEMAENEDKQFLVSTHSEHFINSLLKSVVDGKIQDEEVKVYYLNKTRKETKTEFQEINSDGQIKGGLKNFYDTELNNIKTFFKITD